MSVLHDLRCTMMTSNPIEDPESNPMRRETGQRQSDGALDSRTRSHPDAVPVEDGPWETIGTMTYREFERLVLSVQSCPLVVLPPGAAVTGGIPTGERPGRSRTPTSMQE